MVKVRNDGFTIHNVYAITKEIHPKTGKEIPVRNFSKDYRFEPGKVVNVEKEDFDKMINKDYFIEGRIYTKEQYKDRTELVNRQDALKAELDETKDADKQMELREQMELDDEERYLILNNLPHEV